MTSMLQRLVQHGVVHANDPVSFRFKGHVFAARISAAGLLSHCTWNDNPVLQEKVAFTTLTDWCDTCIQELLNEYVTRFSSWKRVRHVPTNTPLAQLREKVRDAGTMPGGDSCSCAGLLCERRKVLELQMQVRDLRQQLEEKSLPKPDTAMADDNPFRLQF